MAAHLALMGVDVSLYDRYETAVASVQKKGGIQICGEIEGFSEISCVTTEMREAIEGRQVLMIVVPAFAHRYIIETAAPYLEDGQILILSPGATCGAIEVHKILSDLQVHKDITIAETDSLVYTCRLIGPARARISAVKKRLSVAAMPVSDTSKVLDVLRGIYPQMEASPNVLYTSFNNVNPVMHPALTLLNLAHCERTRGTFDFYKEAASLSTVKLTEYVDGERLAVAAGMEVEAIPLKQWLSNAYGVDEETLFETIHTLSTGPYLGMTGPSGLDARYITEDVPMGLVPTAWFGRMLGIRTPVMNLLIELASLLTGIDYWNEGRTLENLGLVGMTPEQVRALVNGGSDPRGENMQ